MPVFQSVLNEKNKIMTTANKKIIMKIATVHKIHSHRDDTMKRNKEKQPRNKLSIHEKQPRNKLNIHEKQPRYKLIIL